MKDFQNKQVYCYTTGKACYTERGNTIAQNAVSTM